MPAKAQAQSVPATRRRRTTAGTRLRVLAVGHGAAATGFSRVLDTLVRYLGDDFEFHHFAVNHRTDRVESDRPVYGNPDRLDAHGLERLPDLIERIRPELVLMLNDLWFCCIHARRLASLPNRPALVAYCPVDGVLTRPELYAELARFDQIVAYNEFGREQLVKIPGGAGDLSTECVTGSIESIAHGVDRDVFFPLNRHDLLERCEAKRRLFGNDADLASFIVLNAAKHDARKRLDLTIEGFARFARDKPENVKLYLHTGATFAGPDLRVLAAEAGISDRLLTTAGWLENHPAIDEQRLNLLYNATDVGINTSTGEGWGLISFEHAATGAPQIVPDHTACRELWNDSGLRLPIRATAEHRGLGMLRKRVDPADIASVLERLYSDRGFRRSQAQSAYANSMRDCYRWDKIAEQWDDLLRTVHRQQRK